MSMGFAGGDTLLAPPPPLEEAPPPPKKAARLILGVTLAAGGTPTEGLPVVRSTQLMAIFQIDLFQ